MTIQFGAHIVLFFFGRLALGYAAQLPYDPTYLLLGLEEANTAYSLRSSSDPDVNPSLAYLDLTKPIKGSSNQWTVVDPSPPFLERGSRKSVIPFVDHVGVLNAWVGDCTSFEANSGLWRLTDLSGRELTNGSWTFETMSSPNGSHISDLPPPKFLAAGIAVPHTVGGSNSNTNFYVFGGMCPRNVTNTSSVNWQMEADYSADVIQLLEVSDSSRSSIVRLEAKSKPPVPQAGHSMIRLKPSYAQQPDGNESVQQTFVIIGGHTQTAFINMTQVGLFSLPQASWTYVPVDSPQATDEGSSLSAEKAIDIQPRSGHSAVLSSDGTKIIVFGGWVGDISTPATPQLIVLEVGNSAAENHTWRWVSPSPANMRSQDLAGLFGHGAVMLPGDIMMVNGGYKIAAPRTKSRSKRSTLKIVNQDTLFYNATSGSWIEEYIPPSWHGTDSGTGRRTRAPFSLTVQKAALVAGLVCAAILVLLLALALCSYRRRLKEQRERVRQAADDLAATTSERHDPRKVPYPFYGAQTSFPSKRISQQHNGHEICLTSASLSPSFGVDWRRTAADTAHRSGLLIEIPSPTRGLRRNVSRSHVHVPPGKQSDVHSRSEEHGPTLLAPKIRRWDDDRYTCLSHVNFAQHPESREPRALTVCRATRETKPPVASRPLRVDNTIVSQNRPVSPSNYSERTRSTLSEVSSLSSSMPIHAYGVQSAAAPIRSLAFEGVPTTSTKEPDLNNDDLDAKEATYLEYQDAPHAVCKSHPSSAPSTNLPRLKPGEGLPTVRCQTSWDEICGELSSVDGNINANALVKTVPCRTYGAHFSITPNERFLYKEESIPGTSPPGLPSSNRSMAHKDSEAMVGLGGDPVFNPNYRTGPSLLSSVRKVLGVDRKGSARSTAPSFATSDVCPVSPLLGDGKFANGNFISIQPVTGTCPSKAVEGSGSISAAAPQRSASFGSGTLGASLSFWKRRKGLFADAETEITPMTPLAEVSEKDLEASLDLFSQENSVLMTYTRPRERLRVVNVDEDRVSVRGEDDCTMLLNHDDASWPRFAM